MTIKELKELYDRINKLTKYDESGGCSRGCCTPTFGQEEDGKYVLIEDVLCLIDYQEVKCPVCDEPMDIFLNSCDNRCWNCNSLYEI